MKKNIIFVIILFNFIILNCSDKNEAKAVPAKTEYSKSVETQSPKPKIDENIIGSWKWSIINATINLKKVENTYILEMLFDDGSKRERNVSLKKNGSLFEIRVLDDNPRGEFYKINNTGDLEFWDDEGKSGSAVVTKKLNM